MVGSTNMFVDWKRFGKEICDVVVGSYPEDFELTLSNSVSQPMKAQIDGFCLGCLECISSQSHGTSVVAINGSGFLRMTKCSSDDSHPNSVTSHHVCSTILSLTRGRCDHVEDTTHVECSTIETRVGGGSVMPAKISETTSA